MLRYQWLHLCLETAVTDLKLMKHCFFAFDHSEQDVSSIYASHLSGEYQNIRMSQKYTQKIPPSIQLSKPQTSEFRCSI